MSLHPHGFSPTWKPKWIDFLLVRPRHVRSRHSLQMFLGDCAGCTVLRSVGLMRTELWRDQEDLIWVTTNDGL